MQTEGLVEGAGLSPVCDMSLGRLFFHRYKLFLISRITSIRVWNLYVIVLGEVLTISPASSRMKLASSRQEDCTPKGLGIVLKSVRSGSDFSISTWVFSVLTC